MKKLSFWKRLFLPVQFPYACRLCDDQNPDFKSARSQSREGDELQIVHLPDEANPLGVFVYNVSINLVIGCLTKHSAQRLIKAFGKGFCVDGEVLVWIAERDDFRVDVLVFDKQSLMKNADFSSLHE